MIGDVGGDDRRHIGDEAMLEANIDALRRLMPEAEITVISRDPAWIKEHYGVGPTSDFDAAFVSGGGNLTSTWPELLHARIELLNHAKARGVPAVVVGQTIGPRLTRSERRQLADALSYASLVGVRERPSYELARKLGVTKERLWYQSDDALFLAPPREESGAIAVTIDPQIRAAGIFDALRAQLDELSRATGAPIVIVPHAWGTEPSDLTESRLLNLGTIAENLTAAEAARIAANASLVISTRYHPIVFAMGAATPAIGIHGDDYCRIKLEGALAHAELEKWALTYRDVRRGKLLKKALEVWETLEKIRRHLESYQHDWRAEYDARWAAIVRALSA